MSSVDLPPGLGVLYLYDSIVAIFCTVEEDDWKHTDPHFKVIDYEIKKCLELPEILHGS